MIELGQILEGLVLRTTEGKLKWNRTVQDDRFVTSLDAISVVIVGTQGHEELGYRLDILEESGVTVESFGIRDTTVEQDQLMERLHVLARRSALNTDATLEKLAKALNL